jgi:hypothetical protein
MKFKFKKVLTFEEYKTEAYKFWYKENWLSKVKKQQFLEKYGEQYVVDYSFADSNGFWGQRIQDIFVSRDKNSHDSVREYFDEIMKDKQKKNEIGEYKIHSVGIA